MLILLLFSPNARRLWLAAVILAASGLWCAALVRYGDGQANTVFAINAGVVLAARWAAGRITRAVRSKVRHG